MKSKDTNPLLTGQAMPVNETSPTDEVHAEETGQVPASDILNKGTDTPPSATSDADGGSSIASETAPGNPHGKPMMIVPVHQFPDQDPSIVDAIDDGNDSDADSPKKRRKRKTKKNEAEKEDLVIRQFGYRALDFGDWQNYIQIGCNLYLKYYALDASGHMTLCLQPWSAAQLKNDLRDAGRARDADLIPRYIGMGSFPSHINYQECVCGNYNTYSPLMHQPAPGGWPNIEKMIRHIFGDQYELGVDYLQILYLYPKQNLPIILLLSKMRQTGKTTFLNFLKEVFGGNATIVNNEALRSNFNAERAGKLLVMCDEAMQDKKEDSERLKALSTAKKTYLEYKGKDRFEIDNFAKIVLCSNNVNDPVYIDVEEVRYWVREVPPLAEDNPNFLEAMKGEIPAFLFALLHRPLSVPAPLSRMWFRPEDLATHALARIKRMCRPTVELDLAEFLLDVMDHFYVDQLQYTNSDLQALLKLHGRDIRDAHRIVCKVWDVPRAANKMAYDLHADWINKTCERAYGRYYTFTRAFLESIVPDYTSDRRSPTPPDPPTPEEGREETNSSLFTD